MKKLFLKSLFICLCINIYIIKECCAKQKEKKLSIEELSTQRDQDSKAIFFTPNARDLHDLHLNDFSSPREFNIRRGLPNFFRKCAAGQSVTIGFIGGSITASGKMYRLQTCNYLKSLFPNCKMIGVNAGRGGTGADLGACRAQEHLIKYNPDLVFIEYAVNGANTDGVEGIIRKVIKNDPKTDIMLVYTVYTGQPKIYADGGVPTNIQKLDKVAAYYNLPSLHMGLQPGILEKEGKIYWAKPEHYTGHKICFTAAGVHPSEAGGDIYASANARAFNAMKNIQADEVMIMPKPFSSRHMQEAKMIDPSIFDLGQKAWKKVDCKNGNSKYEGCKSWFDNLYDADVNSQPLEFEFEGQMFGFLDVGAPDAGAVDIILDGKKIIVTRYRGGHKVLKTEFVNADDPRASSLRFFDLCTEFRDRDYALFLLKKGVHRVSIKVNKNKIDKAKILGLNKEEFAKKAKDYYPQLFHLGKILIDGKLIKK